jgi:para-aminobenzoate synthetase component 1
MNSFFAHLPPSKERKIGLIAKGVKDYFCIEKMANSQDWQSLQFWIDQNKGKYIIAISSYESSFAELKIENQKKDLLETPALIWVVPEEVELLSEAHSLPANNTCLEALFEATESKKEYLDRLHTIQQHLLRGDIYETNYCMQLQSKAQCEEPYQHWLYLYQKNPAPHAAYFKWNQFHLMCLSPERFIKKNGSRLISQPIKGTTARQDDSTKNQEAIASLLSNPKERSENTMIVDLVRNDMSKIAQSKSVEVTELCGIHSFSTLHHMISTIECGTRPNTSLVQIFQALFPMGSMTGVPKKSAVSITHQLEQNSRGWYSGTCGWIDPEGNFDFNVIIRSIIYDEQERIAKIGIGSAITLQSNFLSEWDECWLKAQSLLSKKSQHVA